MCQKVLLVAALLCAVAVCPTPACAQQAKPADVRAALEAQRKQLEQRRETLMNERSKLQADRQNIKTAKQNTAAATSDATQAQKDSRKWVCNAYGTEHDDPSQCSKPEAGGRWINKSNPGLARAEQRQRELQKRLDDMNQLYADELKKFNASIAQLEADVKKLSADLNKAGLGMKPMLLKGDEASVREYTTAAAQRIWSKPISTATQNLANDKELVAELAKAAKESKYFSEADYKVIVAIESQANRNVGTNPSGYKGLFQMGKVAAKDVGYDYSKLADPDEWKTNVAAGTKYLEKNAKDINGRGVPVTPLNMYLAHQQGAKGTADMLRTSAKTYATNKRHGPRC
jgi:hypothetical protein